MKKLLGLSLNYLATILVGITLGMNAVILPTTLEAQEFTSTIIGVIMSLEIVASIGACILLPYFQRFMGLSPMLIIFTLLRVPAIVLLSMYSQLEAWAILVFVIGAASAFTGLGLTGWIIGLPLKQRGLVFALQGTSLSLGTAAGPLVFKYDDLLLPYVEKAMGMVQMPIVTNMEFQLPFLVCGLVGLVAMIPILLSPFFTPKLKVNMKTKIRHIIQVAPAPMNAIAMVGASYYGISAFITVFGLKSGLDISDAAICLTFFMLGGICLDAPISWVSDFVDRRYMVMGLTLVGTLLAIFLPLVIYTPIRAWILLFIWGGINGAMYTIILAMLSERFKEDEQSAVNSAYTLMESIGGTVGVFLIGIAMNYLGVDGFVYVVILANILYFNYALTKYSIE